MGYYIQTDAATGKAQYLIDMHGAEVVECPTSLDGIPKDKALVCVAENGAFDAAALVHDERELADFSLPSDQDPRNRIWLLLDKNTAHRRSGFRQ